MGDCDDITFYSFLLFLLPVYGMSTEKKSVFEGKYLICLTLHRWLADTVNINKQLLLPLLNFSIFIFFSRAFEQPQN